MAGFWLEFKVGAIRNAHIHPSSGRCGLFYLAAQDPREKKKPRLTEVWAKYHQQ